VGRRRRNQRLRQTKEKGQWTTRRKDQTKQTRLRRRVQSSRKIRPGCVRGPKLTRRERGQCITFYLKGKKKIGKKEAQINWKKRTEKEVAEGREGGGRGQEKIFSGGGETASKGRKIWERNYT